MNTMDERCSNTALLGLSGLDEEWKSACSMAAASAAAFLRMITTTSQISQGDILKGLVFHAIWTSNIRHATYTADDLKFVQLDELFPEEMIRPVNVHSVAAYLRIPSETARRKVLRLVQEGRCVRVGRSGVFIPKEEYNKHLAPELVLEEAPRFLSLFTDLKDAGFDFAPYRRQPNNTGQFPADLRHTPNFAAMMRISAEFFLRCLDVLGTLHNSNLITGLIYISLWRCNAQVSRECARRTNIHIFRDVRPKPVPLKAVSSFLGIPYETVRRHANDLLVKERVVRGSSGRARGFCLAPGEISRPEVIAAIRMARAYATRLVGDLHRAGFDFSGY